MERLVGWHSDLKSFCCNVNYIKTLMQGLMNLYLDLGTTMNIIIAKKPTTLSISSNLASICLFIQKLSFYCNGNYIKTLMQGLMNLYLDLGTTINILSSRYLQPCSSLQYLHQFVCLSKSYLYLCQFVTNLY